MLLASFSSDLFTFLFSSLPPIIPPFLSLLFLYSPLPPASPLPLSPSSSYSNPRSPPSSSPLHSFPLPLSPSFPSFPSSSRFLHTMEMSRGLGKGNGGGGDLLPSAIAVSCHSPEYPLRASPNPPTSAAAFLWLSANGPQREVGRRDGECGE